MLALASLFSFFLFLSADWLSASLDHVGWWKVPKVTCSSYRRAVGFFFIFLIIFSSNPSLCKFQFHTGKILTGLASVQWPTSAQLVVSSLARSYSYLVEIRLLGTISVGEVGKPREPEPSRQHSIRDSNVFISVFVYTQPHFLLLFFKIQPHFQKNDLRQECGVGLPRPWIRS